MIKNKKTISKKALEATTGWDVVAPWYDSYLESEDTYQAKVIAPNLLRMLALSSKERVIDLACGQGFFSELCAQTGASVTGVDLSKELLEKARTRTTAITYHHASADTTGLVAHSFDVGIIVLALENIAQTSAVIAELSRLLTEKGRAIIVLLHPSFRIPQHADWQYNTKKGIQQRVVDMYLSERTISIAQNPHTQTKHASSAHTTTYHRSLQWYTKEFRKAGFLIASIEEWISHKTSQAGPKQQMEDAARKEFPLFMAIELLKK